MLPARALRAIPFANAMNVVLHTQMKIISGIQGGTVIDWIFALQQGELQGNCGMNIYDRHQSLAPQMLSDGQV